MKKILFSLLIVIISLNAEIFIKENNVKKELKYEITKDGYLTSNNKIFYDNSSIMIKFNDNNSVLVNLIEEKYNLTLRKTLIIGYYIYIIDDNISDKINEIIDEKNVKTIIPNWKMYVTKR
jgi:predicted component of type VI protein secretion system